jgi:hypothetical protein
MATSHVEKDAHVRAAESARCKRRARRLIAIIAAPAIAALIAATASAEAGKKSAELTDPGGRNSKSTAEKERKSPSVALPVSLAEVASRVDEAALGGQNATEVLRKEVEAEIAAADWSKLPPRKQYKLSASIVSLKAESLDKKTLSATCTVSVSIRDAKRKQPARDPRGAREGHGRRVRLGEGSARRPRGGGPGGHRGRARGDPASPITVGGEARRPPCATFFARCADEEV